MSSQAGQDAWVLSMHPKPGYFVDCGSCHPTELSNTHALEMADWTGIAADIDENAVKLFRNSRKVPCFLGDLSNADVAANFWQRVRPSIDYLSLDLDSATLPALHHFPFATHSFKLATIEHDSYRFGNSIRDAIREMMMLHGYHLARADVTHQNLPFEDWWVHKDL